MEQTGCLIDTARLSKLQSEITDRLTKISQQLNIINGEPFNPSSPDQVKKFFYTRLQLPPLVQYRRGREVVEYGTDVEHLERLKAYHGTAPSLVQEHRLLIKRRGTYIQAILDNVKDGPFGKILKSTFFNTTVVTGRLSSGDPVNLQSIPKRVKPGTPEFVAYITKEIRKCFIAPPGYQIVKYDFSQVEFRIMVVLGNDTDTIKAIQNGLDIHLELVVGLLNSMGNPITYEVAAQLRKTGGKVRLGPLGAQSFPIEALRDFAKNSLYGLSYGQTEQGQLEYALANGLPFTVNDCLAARKVVLAQRPGIKRVIEWATLHALKQGYTESYFGRRMHFPDCLSDQEFKRADGVRSAVNAVIQGTAADVKKIADRRIYDRLVKRNSGARIVMVIHDELVAVVPDNEVNQLKVDFDELAPTVVDWPLPLSIEHGHGRSWGEIE